MRKAGRTALNNTGAGPKVVLVGPMGVGKSTVGVLLAELLGCAYRDTDGDIEAEQGRSVADIFAVAGEAYFRELERRAVSLALAEHDGVLALGGGAVLDAATRALLAAHAVVYLTVNEDEALLRVGPAAERPLLAVNPRKQWRQVMETRRHLYTDVARVVVATDGRSPDEVAQAVLDALGHTLAHAIEKNHRCHSSRSRETGRSIRSAT
ncbi:shikimate kinase [Streptomyces sp. 4N124]|uniref:shikimate kinase n=1 Tax=Streptomyces sp. 4N124 TaxID=3457420 RepID=UPI003FD1EF10